MPEGDNYPFYFRFKDEIVYWFDEYVEVGEIKILDFTEGFFSSISYWNMSDYLNHWRKGLERIGQGLDSAFITNMIDPENANFIEWWVVYVEGDWAYIHNQLLFFDQLEAPFQKDNIYASISPRETYDEDGQKISEWKIALADVLKFDSLLANQLGRICR